MNTLEKICETKREHVRHKKYNKSLDDLRYETEDMPLPSGFLSALKRNSGPSVIAEVKKASPSKGVIRENFNPAEIAEIYEQNGASCVSVLTDEPYFQGNDTYLIDVKNAVNIPILRKDFMIDPYQIYESRALGADCILLIMAALDDALARELYEISISLDLDVLIEVHNLHELERSLRLNPMMMGVNNRNLKTLDVDVNTSYDLLMHIPDGCFKISESGISDHDTLSKLYNSGYKGFLVGESLMKQDDIGLSLLNLMGK